MEEFLRRQAEKEGGAGAVAVASSGKALADLAPPAAAAAATDIPAPAGLNVSGADAISDSDAKRMCREVVTALTGLRAARDMTVNEVRLTLAIESPIVREQREYLGLDGGVGGAGGVSRDDIAAALGEVAAGRVPRDRLALKELHREMTGWPFLEGEGKGGAGAPVPAAAAAAAPPSPSSSPYAAAVDGAKAPGWRSGQARPPPMGRDKDEEPQVRGMEGGDEKGRGGGGGGLGRAQQARGATPRSRLPLLLRAPRRTPSRLPLRAHTEEAPHRSPPPHHRPLPHIPPPPPPPPPPPLSLPCLTTNKTLADRLPDWMGYGFLYFVSAIPVLIAGSVVAILFFNSLR